VPKYFFEDARAQTPKNARITSGLDVYGNVDLVHYESHGVCLQLMYFAAISPIDSNIGYGTKTLKSITTT
jgi:hypothetical protein